MKKSDFIDLLSVNLKNYSEIEVIPPLNVIFGNTELPLHLDVGCASGDFLFDLAFLQLIKIF